MKDIVSCDFCWRECKLKDGQIGPCGIRKRVGDTIVTVGYAHPVSMAIDPMEKKPMYHFLPGRNTLSIALFGCNYTCKFCQNHSISQKESPLYQSVLNGTLDTVTPEEVVQQLLVSKAPVMSYTYSEPIVWQDYMLDIAKLVKDHTLYNCMVTNGSFSRTSLARVLEWIDAFNIDVKGDDEFYHSYCGGALKAVLDSVKTVAATKGKILEVTTMVIEHVHTEEKIRELGKRLLDLGVRVWHLSRFFPRWKMSHVEPTSEQFLQSMLEVAAQSGIEYIYGGNTMSDRWQSTVCPHCHTTLITGRQYGTTAAHFDGATIKNGRCSVCNAEIYGKFQ